VTRKARQLGRNIEQISSDILDWLSAYDWPRNIHELENVLERAILLSPGSSIRLPAVPLGSLPPVRTEEHHARTDTPADARKTDTLQAREREHILHVCQATHWKIKGPDGAASKLGLNPGTLYSRMKNLGIQRPTAR
jgi:DNA-binding NtrC family response regulator